MPSKTIRPIDCEEILSKASAILTEECKKYGVFKSSAAFEKRVREVIEELVKPFEVEVDFAPNPQIFPDVVLGECGVEVKFTENDTWRSIANSVFEGSRSESVKNIYVLFGKMGGRPTVSWGRYEDCVIHVRTSHVPRFEIEIPQEGETPKEPLFQKFGISYPDFCTLPIHERMNFVRAYARSRLKPGERLWWLEDRPDQGHSLPMQVRLYMSLTQEEKRQMRAEAALLCPQIVMPSRSKKKYDDAALYLLTYRGVLCSQARDLFSAGSVALRANGRRGGNYLLRALTDIEDEMKRAAVELDDALFVEYWGSSMPPRKRIMEWLKRADALAVGWRPSRELFQEG